MKTLLLALTLSLLALTGCSTTGSLKKPTTSGNAGTTALVSYSLSGFFAGKYFALPLCNSPPVYPCKTQALNDKLDRADTAAHDAAIAANAAVNDPTAQHKAMEKLDTLKNALAQPEIKKQVDLVNQSKKDAGGAP